MNARSLKLFLVLYLLSTVAAYCVLFWDARKLISAGAPDFAIYYCAGTVVRQGLGHQLYDPSVRFEVERQFAAAVPQFRGPLPYYHPPFEALIFAPFTYLPFVQAYVAWNVFNCVLLVLLLFLLRPHLTQLQSYSRLLWILGSWAFFPVFFTFLQAQDAILLLFVYTLTYLCLKTNRHASAGAWLGLGLFKYHLVLPFLVLWLFQKGRTADKLKLVSGFLPLALLTGLVSVAIAGAKSIAAYPRYVLHWENILGGGERIIAHMPNLRGLAYLFLPPGPYALALVVLLSLVLIVYAARNCRVAPQMESFDVRYSLAMVTTVLVSYHVVSYDLSMLLLPVALLSNHLLSEERRRLGGPRVLVVVAIATLYFSPLQLYLSLRYKQFSLMAIVLLLWTWGIAGELRVRSPMDPQAAG